MSTLTVYLPKNARVIVAQGSPVQVGQALIDENLADNVTYNAGVLLGLHTPLTAQQTATIIQKKAGDDIKKGDVVFLQKHLFGSKRLKATFDGKVVRVDYEKGEIEVTPLPPDNAPRQNTVVSPVAGKIQKITKSDITISFTGTVVFAKQGMGPIRKGKIHVLSKADEDVGLTSIKEEYRDGVLLAGHMSRQVLQKAFGIGVASVLLTAIDDGDFAYFESQSIFTPSLLIFAKADYDTLKKYDGKEAVAEGIHKRVVIS